MKKLTLEDVKTNKYFTTTLCTNAVTNPTNKLPNCTTFAICAWHWCYGAPDRVALFKNRAAGGFGNAKLWYSEYKFDKGATPKIGSIACWTGTYGHVAFVYDFEDLGNGYYNIKVYESNLSGRTNPSLYFRDITYKVKVGVANNSTLGAFLGFCYHPYYKEEPASKPVEQPKPTTTTKTYKVGTNYQLVAILKVRTGAGTNYKQKTYWQLTSGGRSGAYMIGANAGCLKKGIWVTCLEVKNVGNQTWIRIPSGWVCAVNNGSIYIK